MQTKQIKEQYVNKKALCFTKLSVAEIVVVDSVVDVDNVVIAVDDDVVIVGVTCVVSLIIVVDQHQQQ